MKRLWIACVALALLTIGSLPFAPGIGTTALAAAPKTSNPGVTVTFANRPADSIFPGFPGDAIVGDGAPYVDGVGRIEGQIYVTGSGDMTLNLNFTRPKRAFYGTYTPATDVVQPPGTSPPSGAFTDGGFINIHRVWQMGVFETKQTDASFTTGIGDFRWCGDPTLPQWCRLPSPQAVNVTRDAHDKWTVEANPPSGPGTLDGTDLSLFLLKTPSRLEPSGYYHMPFKLTIECHNPCQ
jgi:hypothetical protein